MIHLCKYRHIIQWEIRVLLRRISGETLNRMEVY